MKILYRIIGIKPELIPFFIYFYIFLIYLDKTIIKKNLLLIYWLCRNMKIGLSYLPGF